MISSNLPMIPLRKLRPREGTIHSWPHGKSAQAGQGFQGQLGLCSGHRENVFDPGAKPTHLLLVRSLKPRMDFTDDHLQPIC